MVPDHRYLRPILRIAVSMIVVLAFASHWHDNLGSFQKSGSLRPSIYFQRYAGVGFLLEVRRVRLGQNWYHLQLLRRYPASPLLLFLSFLWVLVEIKTFRTGRSGGLEPAQRPTQRSTQRMLRALTAATTAEPHRPDLPDPLPTCERLSTPAPSPGGSGSPDGSADPDETEALEQALVHLEVGEPAVAVALLKNLLKRPRVNRRLILYHLVIAHCQTRQLDMARSALDELPWGELPVMKRYKLAAILHDCRLPELAIPIYENICCEDAGFLDVAERLARAHEIVTCGGAEAYDQELIKLLDNRYTDVRILGNGAMGVVFSSWDVLVKRWVAVKMLSPFLRDDVEAKRRFVREGKILKDLSHPNIVETFEVHSGPCPYYSMELLTGASLADLIRTDAPFPLMVAKALAGEVLSALEYCHAKSVVHRDIKPHNIVIPQTGQLKVIDFGLVRNANSTHLTVDGAVMGTPAYMSPEQMRGEAVDHHSDLYSFGIVLYEMVTGRLPFTPSESMHVQVMLGQYDLPSKVRDDLSPSIDACVARCMHRDPALRYHTAAEMYYGIEHAFHEHFQHAAAPPADGTLDDPRATLHAHGS
jgi:tRNA A-37 threonylcarbamoyl transferase component Bud32